MQAVLWMAPFYSGGGYCSEAYTFVSSIYQYITKSPILTETFALFISQHGDSFSQEYFKSLTTNESKLMQKLDINYNFQKYKQMKFNHSIAICHSEPGAWSVPNAYYETVQCPPNGYDVKIGRTMFETNRLPDGWINRLNTMDEVWVPTLFSYDIFMNEGVKQEKLRIIPEPVDTDFYSPKIIENILQLHHQHKFKHSGLQELINIRKEFKNSAVFYLFVGKWEIRKGLKILLRAYFKEFYNNTNNNNSINNTASSIVDDTQSNVLSAIMSNIHILTNIKQKYLPYLYSLVNVLVIPSHGEGWGRPHVEAMACGMYFNDYY